MDLNDEQFRYLSAQKEMPANNSWKFDFSISIEEKILHTKDGSTYIGCDFNQLTVTGTYRI